MVLSITYNPYLLETDFRIDGDPEANNAAWAKYLHRRRLQTWFYPAPNWRGFAAELEESLNMGHVIIDFQGRSADYRDLKLFFKAWNKQEGHLTHFEVRPLQYRLEGEKDVLKRLDKLVATFPESPVESLRDPAIMQAYERERDDNFEMAVVATMSSGKSTLLNALLASNLLPAANDATTAKITRIVDVDGADGFTVACRDRDDKIVHGKVPATPELLDQYNKDPRVFYVDLEGDIPEISSETLRLNILDTPGPNNSATNEHREVTDSVLRDKNRQPIILYVMDSTKPEDESDRDLLQDIAAIIKEGGQQAQERFIFVMNKADMTDPKKDGEIAQIIARRQAYLKNICGIDATQIIPVSARAAMLFRMKSEGLARTEDEEDDLMLYESKMPRKKLDEAALLTPGCAEKLRAMKAQAAEEQDAQMLRLIASGIVGLELTINEYLEKYAYPYKINRIVQTFQKRLNEEIQHANYTDTIANSKEELESARKALRDAVSKKDALAERRVELEKRANFINMDESVFTEYRRIMRNRMSDALDGYRGDEIRVSQKNTFMKKVSDAKDRVLADVKRDLKNALNKQLKDDFEPVYAAFSQALSSLQDTNVAGIDFENVEGICNVSEMLEKISTKSLDDMDISSYTYTKTHKETRWEQNPERKGFFGFFKFWKPKEIQKTVTVKDGEFIKADEFCSEILEQVATEFVEQLMQSKAGFDTIYQAKKQECQGFLKAMQEAFEKELQKIESLTAAVENNEADLAHNEYCMQWMNERKTELSEVIQFVESGEEESC